MEQNNRGAVLGVLLLAVLILLLLVGIRVGVALAETSEELTATADIDEALFLTPAPPLPAPSPAVVVTPTPSPTPMATPTPVPTPEPQTMDVALTFYTCEPFCIGDLMANGKPLHLGAVACGYALDEGQRFLFQGEEFRCEDRGGGPWAWVDFFQPTDAVGREWQARVGMTGTITLLGSGE